MTVAGDGSWVAERQNPWPKPARTRELGHGKLSRAALQQLLELAVEPGPVGGAAFVALPAEVNDKTLGSGTSRIHLTLSDGHHDVLVVGRRPAAFQRLAEAIAKETVGQAKLQPLLK